ncbi:MAG: hypothetical protein K2X03_00280 [Bryobacteraceae bacterium]|nr:hypothetical protein [Bryobacteraceae bacterium]
MLRRDLLLGSAATLAPAAAAPSWDAGKLFHLLPTVSDRRLLIKATFTERQSRPPSLRVAGRLVTGKQTDYRGSCWSFDADGLEPARPYELQLLDAAKKPLCAPWTLKTFPAPGDQPKNFRLLVYTCAGGDERLMAANGKPNNLSLAQRGRLLDRAMTFSPDAVIANGDHIYWDLKQGDYPPRLDGKLLGLTGKFQRDQPVLGTPNEDVLRTVADQQIARLYGTRFRGVPVFFLQDDHDYFENDDANDRMVTYPPDHFMLQLGRATRRMYYPEFLPDAQRPVGLPGASASDTPAATGEAFGTIRFGSLAEVLLYDCRRYLTLAGPNAVVIPREAENWITRRLADTKVDHVIQAPSLPPAWSCGKWGDWYPDARVGDKLTLDKAKPYWQSGWLAQHDRLMKAASDVRTHIPLFVSGDMHSIAEGHIRRSGKLDFRANPVISMLPGPIGTGENWPSGSRGMRAVVPHHLEMDEKQACLEEDGFLILDFLPTKIVAKFFRWQRSLADATIDTLQPYRESEIPRQG